ncbi:MAG: hypothetical protein QOK38_1592, partial [Acidobacteriaceae bacterium]|nr:hypothetical protein [Acidobacteriaceae bacterium]
MARAQTDLARVSLPDAPIAQQGTTAASTSTPPANAQDQQQRKPSSDEVLRQEEKQRAFGVMPMFQTVSLAQSQNIP